MPHKTFAAKRGEQQGNVRGRNLVSVLGSKLNWCQTLASIFSFLGCKPLRSLRNKDRNIVPYERAMNWEERVFLYNLFAEDISKVEQLLGWDCSDWKL